MADGLADVSEHWQQQLLPSTLEFLVLSCSSLQLAEEELHEQRGGCKLDDSVFTRISAWMMASIWNSSPMPGVSRACAAATLEGHTPDTRSENAE